MCSWRGSTQKQYNGYVSRWQVFCCKRSLDPLQADVKNILDFLTELYEAGLGYSALNTARSALSAVCSLPDKSTVGEHPLVRRFIKGVFQSRPTRPRYNATWDVSVVLDFLKTLYPNNEQTLKWLTLKTLMFTLLVTGQRCHTIHLMDTDNMHEFDDRFVFTLTVLTKTAAPGRNNPVLLLLAFSDKTVCVVSCMKEYLQHTEGLRNSSDSSSLWISFVKPHRAISKDTISRWVKVLMVAAGIDTSVFKPHSTRAAATSAAKQSQVDMTTILATAGWTNAGTFAKFYDKHVTSEGDFAAGVLKGTKQMV